ncbi:DNA-directed RNA polymerases I and III subunit RPAC2 [Erysiphe neolycopersici]|uniref:DNA-directed RNA polymerases I and III subunit RPAC2 n=1 Tax=Erysiphe neolycopersici TaxID=212602 RepID=A0A420HDH5_9PEZI|nr:DNA-directed RNA polymerases I and III subunit RPAC2 [Erysiphe neolycopersici]
MATENTSNNDVTMTEIPEEASPNTEGILFEDTEQQIRILAGSSETAASFEFKNEDHTLANALRPDVEFCGYSMPHPSENIVNIRIQTYEGTTAIQVLEKGFDDLMDLCDIVAEKFVEARQDFVERMEP